MRKYRIVRKGTEYYWVEKNERALFGLGAWHWRRIDHEWFDAHGGGKNYTPDLAGCRAYIESQLNLERAWRAYHASPVEVVEEHG